MSRFQGPAFRCDKIVVIVTLVRCIAGSVGLMFAILRILRKARGNGGYSMFRETRLNKSSVLKKFLFKRISLILIPKSSKLHRYVKKSALSRHNETKV
ncbi:unnamed protein product [Pocillopora meandrina]|uniref:Uncharacterized protein n=1 Tax=Pocillopora meandrina TaxID=46732 RepID=A0AAU9W160_9CNID|nr:unnamed protein product [Pocillopora meandrina]